MLLNAFLGEPETDAGYAEALGSLTVLRKELLKNRTTIEVNDLGAGPGERIVVKRKISDIARSSTQPDKYGLLQYRLVRQVKPQTILELGTSLGFTTSLLAKALPETRIITIEGCENTAELARENFKRLEINNIVQITGSFDEVLDGVFKLYQPIDYIFFDGNHRMAPTLNYFLKSLNHASENAVFVFDDIRWSDQMETAWEEIQKHPGIKLSADLFTMGILMFDKTLPPGRFRIRY